MASGTTHSFVGGLSGFTVALCSQGDDESLVKPIVGTALGTAFGKLPDILEPATNPHHRQFFHSIATFMALGYGVKKAYEWKPQDKLEECIRFALLCAGVGYISHLVLDASTARSLPMIGKL